MSKLVECVPNFSEGRNKEIIDAVAAAISQTEGCRLLDVDPGASTNRTVYTFVGSPEAVIEGALNAARVAFKIIDMSKHKGEHPRMGALDVCPFIPVRNVTMAECISCANVFAERLAQDLHVPDPIDAMLSELANEERKVGAIDHAYMLLVTDPEPMAARGTIFSEWGPQWPFLYLYDGFDFKASLQ